MLMSVCRAVRCVSMIVVVHQFLGHIGEKLPRGGRGAAGPLDPALLARGGEEVIPRELRRIARDVQPLGQRREHEFADAPSVPALAHRGELGEDRKSTRLNSSHDQSSYAVFCLKKKKTMAHTADDQAKTMIAHIIRRTSLQG